MDMTLIKTKITSNMIGSDCFITPNITEFNKMKTGELQAVTVHTNITQRSLKQHKLLFAIFKIVASNTENENYNTVGKVKEQCKIKARYVDYWYTFINEKTGKGQLNIKTKSISFSTLNHIEACGLIDEFINYCASILKITREELIDNATREV